MDLEKVKEELEKDVQGGWLSKVENGHIGDNIRKVKLPNDSYLFYSPNFLLLVPKDTKKDPVILGKGGVNTKIETDGSVIFFPEVARKYIEKVKKIAIWEGPTLFELEDGSIYSTAEELPKGKYIFAGGKLVNVSHLSEEEFEELKKKSPVLIIDREGSINGPSDFKGVDEIGEILESISKGELSPVLIINDIESDQTIAQLPDTEENRNSFAVGPYLVTGIEIREDGRIIHKGEVKRLPSIANKSLLERRKILAKDISTILEKQKNPQLIQILMALTGIASIKSECK